MSKTKLPYEDSDNYRRLLAMIEPKQQTWDLSAADVKAIGWAVDALEVFARRAGAVIVAEASEELEADNTDELIEAMKEGFAVRFADVEAKAEQFATHHHGGIEMSITKCTLSESRCKSCNTPYTEHMGIQGTCAKLREAEAKIAALEKANKSISCAFCGKEFRRSMPEEMPRAMAERIAECNEHPMRAMFDELQEALKVIKMLATFRDGVALTPERVAKLCDEVLKASVKPRLDREGRDVSDLPGLWDEGDTFEKASVK